MTSSSTCLQFYTFFQLTTPICNQQIIKTIFPLCIDFLSPPHPPEFGEMDPSPTYLEESNYGSYEERQSWQLVINYLFRKLAGNGNKETQE